MRKDKNLKQISLNYVKLATCAFVLTVMTLKVNLPPLR